MAGLATRAATKGGAAATCARSGDPWRSSAPAMAATRLRGSPRSAGRLVQLMVAGRLDPLRVRPLLAGLRGGAEEARASAPCAPLRVQAPVFAPLAGTGPRRAVTLGGWPRQAAELRARARTACARGCLVTILFSVAHDAAPPRPGSPKAAGGSRREASGGQRFPGMARSGARRWHRGSRGNWRASRPSASPCDSKRRPGTDSPASARRLLVHA